MLCRYDVVTYPIMCMAYRIAASVRVNMVINIAGGVGNRSVLMSMPATRGAPAIAAWSLGASVFMLSHCKP